MIVQDEVSFVKVKNGSDGSDGTDGKDGSNGKDGANGKDSNMHTAYSWSADGSDRFTDKYPNENLVTGDYFSYFRKATWTSWNSVAKDVNVDENKELTVQVYYRNVIGAATGVRLFFFNSSGALISESKDSNWINEGEEGIAINSVVTPIGTTKIRIILRRNTGQAITTTAEWCYLKLEVGEFSTIYTPSPQDDFNNAWPTYSGTYSSHDKVQSQNPKDYTWARIRGADGLDGKDGQTPKDVISGYLSNESLIVPANPSGVVSSYANAYGDFVVHEGQNKLNSGVTYSKVSETGMTSAINSAGRYTMTALTTDTAMAIYRATYSGVSIDKIVIAVKNKQGATGKVGDTGPQGPPTGITTLPTIPTNPYIGMLWQNTGSNNGYLTGTVYQWNGAKWNIFIFSAENIVATTLSAISANLGNITAGNIKGATIEGTNIIGSTVETRASKVYPDLGAILYWSKLTDALRISGSAGQNRPTYETTYQLDGMSGFGSGPTGAGKDSEWDFGLNGLSYKSGGVTGIGKASYDFTSRGFNIDVGNFTVNDKELSTNGATQLSPASGFSVYSTSDENLPQARRFGKTVTLSGTFTNNNNIAKGWSGVIGYLPGWATPSITHRVLCQGSLSNTFYLQVKPNGELFLERYGTTDTVAFNSGAWLTINTTYLV